MKTISQEAAPLFDAILNYAKEKKISFHTPGHKHGAGIDQKFRDAVGSMLFEMDLTVFEETDSLHDPQGVIRQAQELAAEAYGADATYFLVNGSTVGNHAMILAACEPGEKIIIPRNAHRSVFSGLILSGAVPVYLESPVTPGTISLALQKHPDAKAVLITTPTYQGICVNLKEISQRVHEKGKQLLVDEAHGAHFCFHPALPLSAMKAGADICVQSSHKTLGCLTQASLLHLQGARIDQRRVRRVLQFLQTTSPSYLLLCSLDVARRQMALKGKELLDQTLELAGEARQRLSAIDGLSCFGREVINRNSIADLDVTKLTIDVGPWGWSGYELLKLLNKEYKLQMEYADPRNVLGIVSIGNTKKDIDRLVSALQNIDLQGRRKNKTIFPDWPTVPFSGDMSLSPLSPREATLAKSECLPLEKSTDRISAELLAPYPPGIPLLVPGERITPVILQTIHHLIHLGARILGQEDITLGMIRVVL